MCHQEGTPIPTTLHPTNPPIERAMLAAVRWNENGWTTDDSLEELARLAESADLEVVGSVTQNLSRPNPTSYLGKGKVQEVKAAREDLQYDVLVVDEELSPSQLRNLEETLDVKVIDRTALILDIFARRAQTHEGRLQVELAQLEYRMNRFTRMWTHLSRQTMGGVGLRGPGETQLEVDRRRAQERVTLLKDELAEVHEHREQYRQKRRKSGVPIVALVGYTNAGKSTLLNRLTDADVLAENKLFATLDPTTRKITLPSGREALMTDTVGFINQLPTQLVAAFRATLEEISEADVLVHVVDLTHPNAEEQAATVRKVLGELKVGDKPTVVALNKVDALGGDVPADIREALELPEAYVPVSAVTGQGMDELLARVESALTDTMAEVRVCIPYDHSALVERFHRSGRVASVEYSEQGITMQGLLPQRDAAKLAPYRIAKPA
ncbi:MAG: GTPase HflX [Chloroflexota bacterium]|nr:GTPase HflX [Chloroflexota bacterium]